MRSGGQFLHQDLGVLWKFKNDNRGSTNGIPSEDTIQGDIERSLALHILYVEFRAFVHQILDH